MRSSRNFVVVVALALALAPGCKKNFTTPSKSSPELIVLLGASNGNLAGDTLTYDLDAPYPARDEIGFIADHLRRRGYRPLRQSDYVRGWSDFTDQARQHIYQWMGEWRNKDGDLVTYTLQYRYPAAESPSLTHLFVTASKKPGAAKGLQGGEVDPKTPPNVNHR